MAGRKKAMVAKGPAEEVTAAKAVRTEAAAKKPAPAKKTMETIPAVEFKLLAPDAKEVFLCGDFNNWESNAEDYRMSKDEDNIWRKKLKLQAGRYEYQFVVDGQWWTDPENPNRQSNPYCTENSVITVS